MPSAAGVTRVRRHRERIDEGLRVFAPDITQQLVQQNMHMLFLGVDARDELRDDIEPRVHREHLESLAHCGVHHRELAVIKPQRNQPEHILQHVGHQAVALPSLLQRDTD